MKSATRMLLLAAFFLTGGTAWAQNAQVTFQVDLSDPIIKCRFDPATDAVELRGSMTDWATNAVVMTDENNDRIYTATVELAKGSTHQYKYAINPGEGDDIWEPDPNNNLTVGEGDTQTLESVAFRGTFTNGCDVETADYEITFTVNMKVASFKESTFDPDNNIVVVAGAMNGWSTTADTLFQDFFNPDLYSAVVTWEGAELPPQGETRDIAYKFVIGRTPGTAPDGWESGSDRTFSISGSEVDTDENGLLEIEVPARYYNDVTENDVIAEETAIKFEVDLRPAFYFLADNGRLPNDTQTGDPVTTLTGVAINGPVAANADGLTDWATWGPNDLFQIATRVFKDDGTQGDVMAGDSIYTQTLTYAAGTPLVLVGKMGTDGWDNEGAFGGDTYFNIGAAAQSDGVLRHIFGAIRRADGRYTDLRGPSNPGSQSDQPAYDPYISISSDSLTASVVRRGGSAVGIEDLGGEIPAAFTLEGNFPNPFTGGTAFRYTLPQAQHVTVRVFDATGREVATLVDAFQAASTYEVSFSGDGLPSGVYFYQVQAGGQSSVRTMTLVK